MRPDIDAIRARADAATPGDWWPPHFSTNIETDGCRCRYILCGHLCGAIGKIYVHNGIKLAVDGSNDCPPEAEAIANGYFIASARTDIPDLLDYIAELEK